MRAKTPWRLRGRAARAVAGVLLALALPVAEAGAGPPPFHAPEELAIFAPEVARVVLGALEHAGLDGVGVLTGRIERLDAERVRLRAQIAGHAPSAAVMIEGPLEQIDALAADLGKRLVEQVQGAGRVAERNLVAHTGGGPPVSRPHAPATLVADDTAAHAVDAAPVALPTLPAPAVPSDERGAEVTPALPAALDKIIPPSPPPPSPPPATPPPPADKPPPAAALPAPANPVPANPVPANPAPANPAPAVVSAPPSAPTLGPPPGGVTHPGHATGFRPLGRAILRTVALPGGCAQGEWATLAARQLLERRLLLTTTRGGCGVVPTRDAAAEAERAGVPTVVMIAVEELNLEPVAAGMRPSGRVRVLVVHEGRVIYARAHDVSSHPLVDGDPARAAYDLTTAALSRALPELQAALAASVAGSAARAQEFPPLR